MQRVKEFFSLFAVLWFCEAIIFGVYSYENDLPVPSQSTIIIVLVATMVVSLALTWKPKTKLSKG